MELEPNETKDREQKTNYLRCFWLKNFLFLSQWGGEKKIKGFLEKFFVAPEGFFGILQFYQSSGSLT